MDGEFGDDYPPTACSSGDQSANGYQNISQQNKINLQHKKLLEKIEYVESKINKTQDLILEERRRIDGQPNSKKTKDIRKLHKKLDSYQRKLEELEAKESSFKLVNTRKQLLRGIPGSLKSLVSPGKKLARSSCKSSATECLAEDNLGGYINYGFSDSLESLNGSAESIDEADKLIHAPEAPLENENHELREKRKEIEMKISMHEDLIHQEQIVCNENLEEYLRIANITSVDSTNDIKIDFIKKNAHSKQKLAELEGELNFFYEQYEKLEEVDLFCQVETGKNEVDCDIDPCKAINVSCEQNTLTIAEVAQSLEDDIISPSKPSSQPEEANDSHEELQCQDSNYVTIKDASSLQSPYQKVEECPDTHRLKTLELQVEKLVNDVTFLRHAFEEQRYRNDRLEEQINSVEEKHLYQFDTLRQELLSACEDGSNQVELKFRGFHDQLDALQIQQREQTWDKILADIAYKCLQLTWFVVNALVNITSPFLSPVASYLAVLFAGLLITYYILNS